MRIKGGSPLKDKNKILKTMRRKNDTFTIILEEDEDGNIIAEVAGLSGCHSWGETREEALQNIREALELYLDVEKDATPLKFLGIEELRVAG